MSTGVDLEENFEVVIKNNQAIFISNQQLQESNQELKAQNEYLRMQIGKFIKQKQKVFASPPGLSMEIKIRQETIHWVLLIRWSLYGEQGESEDSLLTPIILELKS